MAFTPIATLEADILGGYNAEVDNIQRQERADLEYQRLLETMEFERKRRPQQLRQGQLANDNAQENLFRQQDAGQVRRAGLPGEIAGAAAVSTAKVNSQAQLTDALTKLYPKQVEGKIAVAEGQVLTQQNRVELNEVTQKAARLQQEVSVLQSQLTIDMDPDVRKQTEAQIKAKTNQANALAAQQKYLLESGTIQKQIDAKSAKADADIATANNTVALAPQALAAKRSQYSRDIQLNPLKVKAQAMKNAQARRDEGLMNKIDIAFGNYQQMQDALTDPTTVKRLMDRWGTDETETRARMAENVATRKERLAEWVAYQEGDFGKSSGKSGEDNEFDDLLAGTGTGAAGTPQRSLFPNAKKNLGKKESSTANNQQRGTNSATANGSQHSTKSKPVRSNVNINANETTSPELRKDLGSRATDATRIEEAVSVSPLRAEVMYKQILPDRTTGMGTFKNKITEKSSANAAVRYLQSKGESKARARELVKKLIDKIRESNKNVPLPDWN